MNNVEATDLTFVPTAEAAFLAGVTDRDMNRVVDECLLSEPLVRTDSRRSFTRVAAALARFYFSTDDIYVATLRLRVLEQLAARMAATKDKVAVWNLKLLPEDFDWCVELTANSMSVVVDTSSAIRTTVEKARQVREARALVSTDPEVMGGLPVFVGTRLPVEAIAASTANVFDKERLVEAWPFLTDSHFEAAGVYMRVHPRRGRPRRLDELNPNWRVSSTRVVRLARA